MESAESLEKIGRIALRFNLLNEEQLQQALVQLQAETPRERAGQTLVDMGLLSEKQLDYIVNAQEMKTIHVKDIKFGAIAVEKGYVTEPQVEDVLKRQKQHFIKHKEKRLIGDMMVEEQTITEDQKQSVIETQQELIRARAMVAHDADELLTGEAGLGLMISRDKLKATLQVPAGQKGDEVLAQIHALLEEYGVTYGVATDESILSWLESEGRDEHFTVANGKRPIAGHGGEFTYHFDTDPLKAGKIKDGDVIDFKDRGEIPQVAEGALLLELSDPDPGVPGSTVHGEELPPKARKAKKLRAGKGVNLINEGKQLVAAVAGSPSLVGAGKVSVFPLHKIEGDVGYKTGHVDFEGEIQVTGTVEKDFRVSGGRLTAKEVEAAEINMKGDVVISGGVMGAHIKCGGNLMAAYLHNCTLEVTGDILVQKEIRGCDIKCGGGLYSETSIVLDSRIHTRGGIIAADIGSEVSPPSNLTVGSDALLELHITELKEEIAQMREQQETLRKEVEEGKAENDQIDMDIAEVAQVQDRSQVEQRELGAQRDALVEQGEKAQADELAKQVEEAVARASEAEQKLDALFNRQDEIAAKNPEKEQEIENIEELLFYRTQDLEALEQQQEEEQEDVYVKVVGTLYPETMITTAHTSVKTKQEMKSLLIREKAVRNKAGDEVWKISTINL